MPTGIQSAVLSACYAFLRPIARLLIKNGISYREFAEISKSAFVEVASEDYGIRGRKTNMSRVAVMTGLSRKEIKKVRESISGKTHRIPSRTRRPELVLTIWHTHPEFQDSHGQPKTLPFQGSDACFRSLVARAGGDIPPMAMLNELLRAGSVVKEGSNLRVVSRSYIPEPHDPLRILFAGGALRDLASTIVHNLESEDSEMRFVERRVYSDRLAMSQRSRFKKLARDKSELLLQDLHTWLSERESNTPQVDGEGITRRIGVGVYFFDDSVAGDQPEEVI